MRLTGDEPPPLWGGIFILGTFSQGLRPWLWTSAPSGANPMPSQWSNQELIPGLFLNHRLQRFTHELHTGWQRCPLILTRSVSEACGAITSLTLRVSMIAVAIVVYATHQ